MATQISPMLAVSDPKAAVAFYEAAFGATVSWVVDNGGVAGLQIGGADFFLAEATPEYGTQGPDVAGFTTIRIELFVDDPHAVLARAVAAGATERSPITEYDYQTKGARPLPRMLQGSVTDPFGHRWLIGKFLA